MYYNAILGIYGFYMNESRTFTTSKNVYLKKNKNIFCNANNYYNNIIYYKMACVINQ